MLLSDTILHIAPLSQKLLIYTLFLITIKLQLFGWTDPNFLLFSDDSIGLDPPGQYNLVLGGVNMWSTSLNQGPCFHGDCKVLS